ncbi:MAG: transposase [Anaerolineaceae bacterium]|nr:transposase [Anaerolineaceae bacterium]
MVMKTGVCPVCGSEDIYTNWAMPPANQRIWRSYHYDVLEIVRGRHARMEQYVCANCGCIQSYVAPDRINLIRRRWLKVTGKLKVTRKISDAAVTSLRQATADKHKTITHLTKSVSEYVEEPELITQEAPTVSVPDEEYDEAAYEEAYYEDEIGEALDNDDTDAPVEVGSGHNGYHQNDAIHDDVQYTEPYVEEYDNTDFEQYATADSEAETAYEEPYEEVYEEPAAFQEDYVDEQEDVPDQAAVSESRRAYIDDYVEMTDTPLPVIEAIVTDSRPPTPPKPVHEDDWEPVLIRLSDEQWAIIDAMLPQARIDSRVKYKQQDIVEGILYKQVNDIPWSQLPDIFPPHRNVYNYWKRWCKAGIWPEIAYMLADAFGVTLNGDDC